MNHGSEALAPILTMEHDNEMTAAAAAHPDKLAGEAVYMQFEGEEERLGDIATGQSLAISLANPTQDPSLTLHVCVSEDCVTVLRFVVSH